jgi:hypothetical protein
MGIALGDGGSLESLTVTPVFPGGNGLASLVIPDNLFPDIKGSLRYSSGAKADAKTVGETAMGARAKGVINGANFVIGFKQVASFRFHTAFYAGIKDTDGSIEETSTGLNFRHFLDCATNENLQSPQAPFYLPKVVAPNGKEFNIEMPDQPAGKLRLQRRNSLKDRLNFLVAYRSHTEFLTYFVVEKKDLSHLPIKGFAWNYVHDIDVVWLKGQPSVQRNAGTAKFVSAVDSLTSGEARFDILANKSLTGADTIVTKFNSAMFAAQKKQPTSDYAITELPNYGTNLTPEMIRRIENTGT